MGVIAYEERHAIRDAFPALGALVIFLFVAGCLAVLDYFIRALFGTVDRAVGWIPYAGKILTAPVHKIEQKVSHQLGLAERAIDRRLATSFHKLARIIRALPRELAMQAALVLTVVAALDHYLTFDRFERIMRRAFKAVYGFIARDFRLAHHASKTAHAAQHAATHAEKGAQVVAARAATLEGTRRRSRTAAREHAQDLALSRLWKWVRHRPSTYTTAAFLAASAWALSKLGISWTRCSNWKRLGRQVCGMPSSAITQLLGLLALAFAITDIRRTAEFAESIGEEVARDIVRLVHGGDTPSGRFTIE